MGARSEFTAQTLSVLAALCQEPHHWQHGYALAKQTGLRSGTLYPILIRLADRGLMEAHWQDEQPPGRPRRHLYRLTPTGLATAREALTAMAPPARTAVAAGQGKKLRNALELTGGALIGVPVEGVTSMSTQ